MSSILNVRFDGGYVSTGTGGRDASDLDAGELQQMSGAYYRKDDPHQAWKMNGRSLFASTGVSSGIKGIAICQFDEEGFDKILALSGTVLYGATPGLSGTWSSLVTGLSSEPTTFMAAHQEDRWYLFDGFDENRVLMPDGTVRLMGLKAASQPTAIPGAALGLTTYRPTADAAEASGGFTNPFFARDSDVTTCATVITPADSNPSDPQFLTFTHKWTDFTGDTTAGRKLRIRIGGYLGINNPHHPSFITVSKSEDGGGSFAIIQQFVGGAVDQTITPRWLESDVTDGINSNQVQVRVSVSSVYYGTQANVFDIRIDRGASGSFTTTTGIYYLVTEVFDSEFLEGPPSTASLKVELLASGQVVVTRGPVINPAATHWRVYRTIDGLDVIDGAAPPLDNFGFVSGDISISDTTWTDRFDTPITEQAVPIVPLLQVGELLFPRDAPPTPFVSMMSWKGSMCGISIGSPRAWFYSEGGRPESWPVVYQVKHFPLDENDGLVGQMPIGETAVLLCGGAILALDDIPRVTDGQFNPANARPLKGHPGCVGYYAYTPYSVAGEPRGAWVSPYGVYVTNGTICECISTDLAWEREVNVPFLGTSVLRWDAKNLILWFEFDLDGDGKNDREMPFHMAQAHSKGENKPKLGQPTAKASSCMAAALVNAAYFRYSGDPSVGKVYVEESGTVDADTGSEVVMTVKSSQVSHNKVNLGVVKATLAHSDFGSGVTGTIVATLYRDSSNSENSRSQSVRLDGNRGTTVGIGRAGELVDVSVTYSGSGIGGVGGVQLEIDGQGRSGSAPRVTSNSATP